MEEGVNQTCLIKAYGEAPIPSQLHLLKAGKIDLSWPCLNSKRQGKWWAREAETSLVMPVASPRVNEGQPGLPWGKGGHAKR